MGRGKELGRVGVGADDVRSWGPMERLRQLKVPALVSTLLVLPLLALELSFNQGGRASSPGKYALDMTLLFGLLWLLPVAFIAGLMPLVRGARAGAGVLQHPVRLLVHIGLLTLFAVVWTAILVDQLPCFLGVANAD